ncbi:SET and MYND domain-containing protein 4-like [Chelonus insularis]|uniref:SET and MYND domain-containing protein 4-like n=1 Tax=Chelonus insularis TaxID=460826 RepID=UPI00158A33C6|nr:SET and MYND domain-containing protein 4-like [Chelonus insularis]
MLEDESTSEIPKYFRSNLLACREAIAPEDFKKFVGLNTNSERVAFILSYPEAHDLPLEIENRLIKDSQKALKLKENGNKLFGQQKYILALETYTKAIIISPKKEMSIYLANRSAALYNLEYYEFALRDIEEALSRGYPKELEYKLLERRARCFLGLKRNAPAIEAFQKALISLDDAKVPFEKKQKLEMDIRIMLTMMEKGNQISEKSKSANSQTEKTKKNSNVKNEHNIPKIPNCNPLYPSVSSAVEIREGGEIIGRHGIATRDIMPGDLLIVEKPHVSVLLNEFRLSNCHRCMKKNIAPYPADCDKCIIIAYCSPKCRDEDTQIHAMECNILGCLWLSEVSVTSLMAIKAIMQTPWAKLQQLKNDYKKYKGNFKASTERPFRGKDHLALWSMVTHESERTDDDMFHRTYMAAWLLRLIKSSPYLPGESKTLYPDVPLSEDELFIADLLLHHLQLLQFNGHEISELARPRNEPTLARSKSNFIGGGIFPTAALLNHSCNPGVIRYFLGTTMVVRSIRTIRAGEEICDNYGPAFMNEPKVERQRKLRMNYWFDCNCEACTYNWPILDEIDPKILRFKCETGKTCGNVLLVNVDTSEFVIHCNKCNKNTNIMMGLKALQDTDRLFKVASDHLESGENTKALENYYKILKLLDDTLALPIKDYHIAQQGVKLILLSEGNTCVV